jgi:predicted transcriptional regulator
MTHYNGHGQHPRDVSRICIVCSARRTAKARRGTGSNGVVVLAYLKHMGAARAVEISRKLQVSPQQTHVLLRRLMSYGLVERRARGWYALKSEEALE